MIIYFLIGLVWTMFWDWFERSGFGDENYEPRYIDNLTRLIHILCWPLFSLLFIVGWIRGFLRGNDE